ncbi:MAG: hypothetical protein KDB73_16720 [Planctomycetes bacterium]|nr:hypothetical protein [Planctomycetota bacterium]
MGADGPSTSQVVRYGPWCVRSDIALHGLPQASTRDEADVIVLRGQVAVPGDADESCWDDGTEDAAPTLLVFRRGSSHVVQFPAEGVLVSIDAHTPRRITYDARAMTQGTDLGHVLVDQVLPRCLAAWSDHLVMHAAGVQKDGYAWLVAGPSGRGKTTLALDLAERGWTLLGDDAVALSPDARGVRVQRLRGGTRAYGSAWSKSWRPHAHDEDEPVAHLSGVITLLPRSEGALHVERLRGVEAAMALVGSAFRLDPADPSRPAGELEVVQHAPPAGVYAVAVPHGQDGRDELVAWLESAAARAREADVA